MRRFTNLSAIIAAGLFIALVIATGLWVRGYKQRLRAEGALVEAMKAATARRNADSLALVAAQDSLRVTTAALARSSARLAHSAGNWQSLRDTRPSALETFENPPAADSQAAAAPAALDSVMRYARALERSGDSLAAACSSLKTDCETFRAQATVTMARQDSLRADIQRQLDLAIARAKKTQPGAWSRFTRNAGWFLGGVAAGILAIELAK